MRDVEIIPDERDEAAKTAYKFMDWYLRLHREGVLARVMEITRESLMDDARRGICQSLTTGKK